MMGEGQVGEQILRIAEHKCQLSFVEAFFLGILCNILVCLAIWLCYSARSVEGKILAILFPITAFVAAGFEHSVANMYFIPMGLAWKAWAPDSFWLASGLELTQFSSIGWASYFWNNLLPVSLGNIIGGAGFVGLAYWFIYLRNPRSTSKLISNSHE
jgi:formate/nitrite transporter